MIFNLVKAHLKEIFSLKKIALVYISVKLFLVLRLYMFTNELGVIEQSATLLDWVYYSLGGPVGDARLLNGFFFLILLFIIVTFGRSIYEKNPFIYHVVLSKVKSRFNWIISVFISQLINSIIAVFIVVKLSILIGFPHFNSHGISLYFAGSIDVDFLSLLAIFCSIICGIWLLNSYLSIQQLFLNSDFSNQIVHVILMTLLLIIHIFFPFLDNLNPVAYASLNSLLPLSNHLGLTIIFRIAMVLLSNTVLSILSHNSND